MKKIVLVAAALLCMGVAANAQKKADMYVGGTLGFNVGVNGDYTNCGVNILGDYGYFFLDNFRGELALGYAHSSDIYKTNEGKTYQDFDSFVLVPNVAYYIKIFDKFYYTPEFGLNFAWGANTQKVKVNNGGEVKSDPSALFTWAMYLNYAQFEYRPLSYLGLTFSIGTLSVGGRSYDNKTYDGGVEHVYNTLFRFNLNSGSVGARYYF